MKGIKIAGPKSRECVVINLELRLHTTHPPDFCMVKDDDNIYYCTKNQARGFCVGGDSSFFVGFMVKLPYLRLHTTYALDFWCSNTPPCLIFYSFFYFLPCFVDFFKMNGSLQYSILSEYTP